MARNLRASRDPGRRSAPAGRVLVWAAWLGLGTGIALLVDVPPPDPGACAGAPGAPAPQAAPLPPGGPGTPLADLTALAAALEAGLAPTPAALEAFCAGLWRHAPGPAGRALGYQAFERRPPAGGSPTAPAAGLPPGRVTFVATDAAPMPWLLGTDLAEDPAVREALRSALATGAAVLARGTRIPISPDGGEMEGAYLILGVGRLDRPPEPQATAPLAPGFVFVPLAASAARALTASGALGSAGLTAADALPPSLAAGHVPARPSAGAPAGRGAPRARWGLALALGGGLALVGRGLLARREGRRATERAARAERELTLAAERAALAQRSLDDLARGVGAVFWVARPGEPRRLEAAGAFEEIFGHPPAALEADPGLWLARVHPADRDAVGRALAGAGAGQACDLVYRVERPDGTLRWVRDRASAAPPAGEPGLRIFGIAEDVTRLRAATDAAEHAQAQLRHVQKLDAVGRLAGGVAHDFNNLLTAILGYATLALGRLSPQHPVRDMLRGVEHAGRSAAALTAQLLAFSRRQVLHPRRLDLNEVVAATLKLARRLVREDVAIETRAGADVPAVWADAGQIEQVLMNLVINASDAMPEGGTLRVTTASVDAGRAPPSDRAGLGPGRYARIAVRDHGVGMSRAVRERLFEPFFTTKPPGRGTGLGLATAYGIVEQSHGHVAVDSAPGRGTTVRVYLPAHAGGDAAEPEPDAAPPPPLPRGTGERILLVEDNGPLRALASQTLADLGYEVAAAATAEEAVALAAAAAPPPALLLTDVVLPGPSGPALGERLRRRFPALRVLFMSGHAEEAVRRAGVSPAGASFLPKPFLPGDLARKVREVLDAPRP